MPTGLDRWLAYRDRYVYELTQQINDDCAQSNPITLSDEPTDIVLRLTADEFTKMFSALMTGADLIYPFEAHDITWLLWRAVECAQTPETITEVIEIIRETMSASGADCAIDELEKNMALQIQNIGGIDYLVEVCCGGATKFYQLSGVQIDGTGAPIPIADGGRDSFGGGSSSGGGASGSWGGTVSSDNLSCYGTNATTYLLGRVEEFAHSVIDWLFLATDAFAGNYDEVVELALLTGDLLFGTVNLNEIQALTKSEVTAALNASAVTTPLAAAWNYNGSITRSNLREWANNAPWLNGTTPVRSVIQTWIDYSLLIGLNRDLETIAAGCESGNSLPDGFPPDSFLGNTYDWYHSFDLRDAAFVDNNAFDLLDGVYSAGIGYQVTPTTVTFTNNELEMRFNLAGGLGVLTNAWVDYTFTHDPVNINSSILTQTVLGVQYGGTTDFAGIRELTGLSQNTGSTTIRLVTDVNNGGQPVSGTGTVRRIALAGTGSTPFTTLAQV